MNNQLTKPAFERFAEELIGNIERFRTPLDEKIDTDEVLKTYYTVLAGKAFLVDANSEEKEQLLEAAFIKVKMLFGR